MIMRKYLYSTFMVRHTILSKLMNKPHENDYVRSCCQKKVKVNLCSMDHLAKDELHHHGTEVKLQFIPHARMRKGVKQLVLSVCQSDCPVKIFKSEYRQGNQNQQ